MNQQKNNFVSFQGVMGAYSHLAVKRHYPAQSPLPCHDFDTALKKVVDKEADLALIPIENSTFGRVTDIHHLLPGSGLFITAEYFEPINHMLLGLQGAMLSDLKTVISHPQALGQCRNHLKALGLNVEPVADTAGAALQVAQTGDKSLGALASSLAAEVYGLDCLRKNMQDKNNNTTRFISLARHPNDVSALRQKVMTSLIFETKHVPAALFKALGGFATNGVNMTKLESYYDSDSFSTAGFYSEIEGHPNLEPVALALEELTFHSKKVRLLGSFNQARCRKTA